MITAELWKPRRAKRAHVHQMRPRRACLGELVQIDGSPYDWFEGCDRQTIFAGNLLNFFSGELGVVRHLSLNDNNLSGINTARHDDGLLY